MARTKAIPRKVYGWAFVLGGLEETVYITDSQNASTFRRQNKSLISKEAAFFSKHSLDLHRSVTAFSAPKQKEPSVVSTTTRTTSAASDSDDDVTRRRTDSHGELKYTPDNVRYEIFLNRYRANILLTPLNLSISPKITGRLFYQWKREPR